MTSLPRVLGPWMAAAIVVGNVIGTGVFKKGTKVATNAPEFALGISVWIVGGILVLLGALAMAEIAVRLPRAGGNYVYLREGFGKRAAFLWGWVDFWIIRSASIAVLAYMFTEFLHETLKDAQGLASNVIDFWPRQVIAILLIVALTVINVRGTRLGGTVQLGLTILKVTSLIAIALLPLVVTLTVERPAYPPRAANFEPIWPTAINWTKYGVALVAVLWAYDGWMNFGNVAEEIKDPSRNIPRAALGGVLLIIALYVSANVAYYLVIPQPQMAALKDRPLATEFFDRLLGPVGMAVASGIMMVSVLGALNGNVLVAPRLLFAMGQDGLASPKFSELHPRYATPMIGSIAYAIWSILLIVIGGLMTQNRLPLILGIDFNIPNDDTLFDILTDFAIVGIVTMGTLAVAAIFPLRNREPGADLPYRCIGYPLVPILYVLVNVFVLYTMFVDPGQRFKAVVGIGFIAVGAVVFEVFKLKTTSYKLLPNPEGTDESL